MVRSIYRLSLELRQQQAFTAIYNKYVGRIFNYVCAMTIRRGSGQFSDITILLHE